MVIEKKVSLFLVVNLIIAIIAVSYSIGIVSAETRVFEVFDANGKSLGKVTTAQSEQEAISQMKSMGKAAEKATVWTNTGPTSTGTPTDATSGFAASTLAPSYNYKLKESINLVSGTEKFTLSNVDVVNNRIFSDVGGQRLDVTDKVKEVHPDWFKSDGTLNSGIAEKTQPTPNNEGGGIFGLISSIYGFGGGKGALSGGGFIDGIVSAAAWAGTAYYAGKLIGGFLGYDQKKVDAVAMALGFGTLVGRGVFTLAESGRFGLNTLATKIGIGNAGLGLVAGVVSALAIYLLTYKKESQQTVTFECFPWEAPIGGANCEKCNADPYQPCSEYRCKSLGQACGIVNSGTDQEKCVWVNRKDVIAPVIKPWKDALLKGYEYKPDSSIQPPDAGVKVYNTDSTTGCVQAFTPLRFGINTSEASQCKIDYNKPLAGKNAVESQQIFDSMQFFMGGSNLFEYNHSEILSLPGPDAASNNSPILQNDGTYSLYVRCQDANGNANLQSYVFNFCVEKGPDTTAPLIVTTNILNDSPIAYNKTSVDIELYVNEPSSCKWSTNDLAYKDMENPLTCSSSVFEMNANLLYKCTTKLTGLKNAQDNNFYFKCQDHPELPENERNTDSKSYAFTLIGTRTLNILTAKPNGTIKDATDIVPVTLEVETANGYKEGEALCYYSPTGTSDSYIEFRNTNSNLHSQVLNLPEGKYTYFIKCVDLGGNTDSTSVTFKVETDTSAPIIVRVFHEENKLKLITNENATCSYSLQNCNFNIVDGIQFRSIKGVEQFTDWNVDKSYYIRCVDQYGREPLSNQCSIVVKPINLNKKEVVEDTGLVA